MSQKIINSTGWVLTAVIALLFGMSAFMKITANETVIAQAAEVGIDAKTYFLIGIIEIVSLILFIVPRTGVLGTLLLAAYMGGAIATHLEHQQPIAMAVAVQVLVWITAVLRFPELKERLLASPKTTQS